MIFHLAKRELGKVYFAHAIDLHATPSNPPPHFRSIPTLKKKRDSHNQSFLSVFSLGS